MKFIVRPHLAETSIIWFSRFGNVYYKTFDGDCITYSFRGTRIKWSGERDRISADLNMIVLRRSIYYVAHHSQRTFANSHYIQFGTNARGKRNIYGQCARWHTCILSVVFHRMVFTRALRFKD